MALLKYFTVKEKQQNQSQSANSIQLPSPTGPLSQEIPSSSIIATNAEVSKVLNADKAISKRGDYMKLNIKEKAEIGRRAAEEGIASTIRNLAKKYPNLKESTIQTWKSIYLAELKRRRTTKESLTISELPEKKKGRPLLIGSQLEFEVRRYLENLRRNGAVVNTAIAVSCARGIVLKANPDYLASNGGHIVLTNHWGKHLLRRMGFVKWRATTKAKVMVENFEEVKAQFLLDVKAVVEFYDIPSSLIINWDQTGIHYVPVGSWTMEKKGLEESKLLLLKISARLQLYLLLH
uniref:HTH CENPB-type domain-containing protein n=1 Tax=Amphimedon queenslandica TaxID=400682 RepID=A0A1X7SP85_AMPQE